MQILSMMSGLPESIEELDDYAEFEKKIHIFYRYLNQLPSSRYLLNTTMQNALKLSGRDTMKNASDKTFLKENYVSTQENRN
jgi:hypothetical protein